MTLKYGSNSGFWSEEHGGYSDITKNSETNTLNWVEVLEKLSETKITHQFSAGVTHEGFVAYGDFQA